jgi:ArsR family transcriptional regulator
MKMAQKIDRVDLVFRAFSDRTRLRILSMLRGRDELCVCDIVQTLRLPQPKVSRHLAYLRKSGLVLTRKEGLWMYYSLAPAGSPFHRKILECLACCFQDVPELSKDAARLEKSCCEPGCCPP